MKRRTRKTRKPRTNFRKCNTKRRTKNIKRTKRKRSRKTRKLRGGSTKGPELSHTLILAHGCTHYKYKLTKNSLDQFTQTGEKFILPENTYVIHLINTGYMYHISSFLASRMKDIYKSGETLFQDSDTTKTLTASGEKFKEYFRDFETPLLDKNNKWVKDEQGKIIGAKLHDLIEDEKFEVECKVAVNCAGVHADSIR